MRSKRRVKTMVTVLTVGAVAVLGLVISLKFHFGRPGSWEQVTIATATPGGTYYVLGRQLARILERLPGEPIQRVVAEQSLGSRENIQRLINSKADVALVQGPALAEAVRENSEAQQEVRVLARLYSDFLQIVARKNRGIETLTDLKNKKIYIGAESSGTRMITTTILESIGLSEGDYTADGGTYTQAANKLIDEKLDAAFFAAGIPTPAVQDALESGECKLLSLDDDTQAYLTRGDEGLALAETQIPANSYPNQLEPVQTVSTEVFLVSRTELSEELAFVILEALFDNIADLLLAYSKAEDIKLTRAFDVPEDLPLHPGARKFQDKEREKLLIATGALTGKYYQLGRMIQSLLKEHGIPARAIQTDGSLENADLLRTRPTLAIMQYDAALASRFEEASFVYNVDLPNEVAIPSVPNIRRIATLHQEQLHLFIRRDKLKSIRQELKARGFDSDTAAITTLPELAEAQAKMWAATAFVGVSKSEWRRRAWGCARRVLSELLDTV